jgi:signal transduction histidine kinase
VRVSDTGSGIALADQERIFERFYRTPDAEERMVPGAGLGLAITASIVRAHSGTIEVESTPGKGTAFVVRLPAPVTGDAATSVSSPHREGSDR